MRLKMGRTASIGIDYGVRGGPLRLDRGDVKAFDCGGQLDGFYKQRDDSATEDLDWNLQREEWTMNATNTLH
jgi:hypothetical protein